ncbi:hypothetical protein ACLKA7_000074, partial [Drosophila subpalustris]
EAIEPQGSEEVVDPEPNQEVSAEQAEQYDINEQAAQDDIHYDEEAASESETEAENYRSFDDSDSSSS